MLLQRFIKDRRASVVPLFGLSLVPIIALVGAGVDYSRASVVRTAMQTAADTAALAASKSDPATMETDAENYFRAVFSRPEAENLTVSAVHTTTNGQQLVVTGSATVKPVFMGIMGFQELPVSASGTAKWGMTRLRVALVLDNTGSMADPKGDTQTSKISALKTATKNLLGQLNKAASKDGDVYVSIVPFSKDVNVGASNYTSPWIDWTAWDEVNGTCSNPRQTTSSACTTQQACSTNHGSQSGCTKNGGTWGLGTWTRADHSTWNGCVTDRDKNADTTNVAPTAGGTLFVAEQYGSCPASLLAQTYDWTSLNSKVDTMTPAGNTNQTIGLAWGWQSLTEGTPLNAPAMDSHYQYQQVIILLTDGLNTENRWDTTASLIDNRTRAACTNIKNAGITIYAVQVNTGSDPTSTLLQDCASNTTGTTDHFYLLTSADQIIMTFNAIGTTLSKLRIAQ